MSVLAGVEDGDRRPTTGQEAPVRHDMFVCARCSRQITEQSALHCPACRSALTQLRDQPWWNRPEIVGAVLAVLLLVLGVAGQFVR